MNLSGSIPSSFILHTSNMNKTINTEDKSITICQILVKIKVVHLTIGFDLCYSVGKHIFKEKNKLLLVINVNDLLKARSKIKKCNSLCKVHLLSHSLSVWHHLCPHLVHKYHICLSVWLDPYFQLMAKQSSLHADNVHFIRKLEESNTSPVGGWFVKWLPTELQASPGCREAKTERGV